MSFQDGFYKVLFQTPLGQGTGVAYLADGKLHGGDSMVAYVGKYEVGGDKVSASVRVFNHSSVPGMTNVLGTAAATLSLSGTADGRGASLSGNAPQAPGVTLSLRLEPLG